MDECKVMELHKKGNSLLRNIDCEMKTFYNIHRNIMHLKILNTIFVDNKLLLYNRRFPSQRSNFGDGIQTRMFKLRRKRFCFIIDQ